MHAGITLLDNNSHGHLKVLFNCFSCLLPPWQKAPVCRCWVGTKQHNRSVDYCGLGYFCLSTFKDSAKGNFTQKVWKFHKTCTQFAFWIRAVRTFDSSFDTGKGFEVITKRLITHTTHEECISLTEQNRWTTSGALTPFMHPHFRDCDVHDSSHLAENRLTGKSLMAFTRYQSVLCLDWTTSCTSQAGGGPLSTAGMLQKVDVFWWQKMGRTDFSLKMISLKYLHPVGPSPTRALFLSWILELSAGIFWALWPVGGAGKIGGAGEILGTACWCIRHPTCKMFDKIDKKKGICRLCHVWCICILHPAMPIHFPQWNNPSQVSGRHRGPVSSWWFSVSSLIAGDVLFWYNLQLNLHLKISRIRWSWILNGLPTPRTTPSILREKSGTKTLVGILSFFRSPRSSWRNISRTYVVGMWMCAATSLETIKELYAIGKVGGFNVLVHSTYSGALAVLHSDRLDERGYQRQKNISMCKACWNIPERSRWMAARGQEQAQKQGAKHTISAILLFGRPIKSLWSLSVVSHGGQLNSPKHW